jgi:hypothetical protein
MFDLTRKKEIFQVDRAKASGKTRRLPQHLWDII